jgi:hypothetical protein
LADNEHEFIFFVNEIDFLSALHCGIARLSVDILREAERKVASCAVLFSDVRWLNKLLKSVFDFSNLLSRFLKCVWKVTDVHGMYRSKLSLSLPTIRKTLILDV